MCETKEKGSFYGRPTANMMSATMPTLCFTNEASAGSRCKQKKHGTPEKATACATPRKWSSWSGEVQGRDGTAVCAAVCRPSCRWAKARRQKLEKGDKVKGKKRGRGAEERRQLRRQLAVAEARIEELEEVVGDRDLELGLTTEVVVGLEEVVRVVKEKEEQAVVKEWRMKGAVEKERMEWMEKEEGWRAELKEVVERQWAAEVVEVRRAVGREQKWARRVEVLKAQLVAVEGRLRKEQRLCKEAVEGAARGRAKVRRRFRPGQRL
jgi:hypothetical protein